MNINPNINVQQAKSLQVDSNVAKLKEIREGNAFQRTITFEPVKPSWGEYIASWFTNTFSEKVQDHRKKYLDNAALLVAQIIVPGNDIESQTSIAEYIKGHSSTFTDLANNCQDITAEQIEAIFKEVQVPESFEEISDANEFKALKILAKAGNKDAALLVAQCYVFSLEGVVDKINVDKAQKFAELALRIDPEDEKAQKLLNFINLFFVLDEETRNIDGYAALEIAETLRKGINGVVPRDLDNAFDYYEIASETQSKNVKDIFTSTILKDANSGSGSSSDSSYLMALAYNCSILGPVDLEKAKNFCLKIQNDPILGSKSKELLNEIDRKNRNLLRTPEDFFRAAEQEANKFNPDFDRIIEYHREAIRIEHEAGGHGVRNKIENYYDELKKKPNSLKSVLQLAFACHKGIPNLYKQQLQAAIEYYEKAIELGYSREEGNKKIRKIKFLLAREAGGAEAFNTANKLLKKGHDQNARLAVELLQKFATSISSKTDAGTTIKDIFASFKIKADDSKNPDPHAMYVVANFYAVGIKDKDDKVLVPVDTTQARVYYSRAHYKGYDAGLLHEVAKIVLRQPGFKELNEANDLLEDLESASTEDVDNAMELYAKAAKLGFAKDVQEKINEFSDLANKKSDPNAAMLMYRIYHKGIPGVIIRDEKKAQNYRLLYKSNR